MYTILARIVDFGTVTRNRSADKGGGTYDVIQGYCRITDDEGNTQGCNCEAAFNGRASCCPVEGDTVRFVVSSIDLTMPRGLIKFSDVLPVVPKSRDLKQ